MYVNLVLDASISALEEQFLTQGAVRERLGVVTNFYILSHQELMKQCEALRNTLSYRGQYDKDRGELERDSKFDLVNNLLFVLLPFKHL